MRTLGLLSIYLMTALMTVAQSPAPPTAELPKDPQAVFAAAAPSYTLSDPSLKPWHLKVTYQLYDEKGAPAEQGTYEYWWASPQVNRSTWTRSGATHTDWHTADDKHAYLGTGEPLRFSEYQLQREILSPLPDAEHLDPAKYRFDREPMGVGAVKLPCIMVIPQMPFHGQTQPVQMGLFPTYCFDTQQPVLRVSYAFGTATTEFNKLVKMQGRILPREIVMLEGQKEILSAEVDSITGLDPADPALLPAADAKRSSGKRIDVDEAKAATAVVKRVPLVYPEDARRARISGTVMLEATIGVDGALHNLQVLSTPWPSLAAEAMRCVLQWQFKPYMSDGVPVEVKTKFGLNFRIK